MPVPDDGLTPPREPAGPMWRRVAGSTMQKVMTLTAIGMAFGLFFDMLTAARLGATWMADALVVAMGLPNLVDTVLRESTKFSMISVFVERRSVLDAAAFSRFASGILNGSLIFGVSLALLFEAAAYPLVHLMGPGLSVEATRESVLLFRLIVPLVAFAPGATVLSVLFNSRKDFILVALRNASQPVPVVLAFLVFWRFEHVARWAAAAYMLGYLWFFLTLLFNARRIDFAYAPRALPARADLKRVWEAASRPSVGFALRQSVRMFERSVASLVAPGAVAAYYFPFRLFSAGQTLIGTSVATVGIPRMAELDLAGQHGKLRGALMRSVRRALMIAGPAAIIGMVFAHPIVKLLYGHGSFHASSVDLSARCFFWLAMGLALMSLSPVLQSLLYAKRRYNDVLLNMVLTSVVNAVAVWYFAHWWGVPGIAIAATTAAVFSTADLTLMLKRRLAADASAVAPPVTSQ